MWHNTYFIMAKFQARKQSETFVDSIISNHPELASVRTNLISMHNETVNLKAVQATRGFVFQVSMGKQVDSIKSQFKDMKDTLPVEVNTLKLFFAMLKNLKIIDLEYSMLNQYSLIYTYRDMFNGITTEMRMEYGLIDYKANYIFAGLCKKGEITDDMSINERLERFAEERDDKIEAAKKRRQQSIETAAKVKHATVDIQLPSEDNPEAEKKVVHLSAEGFEGVEQSKTALLNKLLTELGAQALTPSNVAAVVKYARENAKSKKAKA